MTKKKLDLLERLHHIQGSLLDLKDSVDDLLCEVNDAIEEA